LKKKENQTMKSSAILVFVLLAATAWTQDTPKKYPWQFEDTGCSEWMTFCWHGSEIVSDPEVKAYGNRWVTQDKDEKPLEWVTEVRCIQKLRICILARNQKIGGGSQTNIDIYPVEEWSDYQIRTVGVGDAPRGSGKECEIDSLLLNRAEASVSMLTVPGPRATTKACLGVMKPKTVIFKLEIGLPKS
jgi:hypothetical protein